MAANVLLSKGKDAVAAAQRAMGMQSDRPQMSEGGMGAAGKMEHVPPGSKTGFARWVLQHTDWLLVGAVVGAAALATGSGLLSARLPIGCCGGRCYSSPSPQLVRSLSHSPTPARLRSDQSVDADAARAKYDEISDAEKPNFPAGEKSVNEMVS